MVLAREHMLTTRFTDGAEFSPIGTFICQHLANDTFNVSVSATPHCSSVSVSALPWPLCLRAAAAVPESFATQARGPCRTHSRLGGLSRGCKAGRRGHICGSSAL